MGTTVFTLNENSGTVDQWLQGGKIYQFRSQDDSARRSGVYKGGEDQGGGAGRASGGDFDITIHDNGANFGDNNTGGSSDMASQWSIQGTRDSLNNKSKRGIVNSNGGSEKLCS